MKRISVFYLLILATLPLGAQDLLQPAAWDDYYDMACRNKLVTYNANAFFMCRPSFTPEYALSFECDGRYFPERQTPLVLKRAEENLWYNDNYPTVDGKRRKRKNRWDSKYHNVKVSTYELIVSREAKALIYDLITVANETATYFNGELSGFDGVTYYFNSGSKYGRAWSPNKKCRTGRLVAVMDSICQAVENGDTTMLNHQLPTCRMLLGEFRNDYPLIAFMPEIYSFKDIYHNDKIFAVKYVDANDDTTSVNRVYLRTDFLWIKRVFPQPVNMLTATEWARTMTERATLMTRKLFLQQDSLKLRFWVLFDEGKDEEYYNERIGYSNHLRLSDTADFERRCLSAPLDKEGLFRRQPDGTWQQTDTTNATQWWKEN